jgi:hypothetical protein
MSKEKAKEVYVRLGVQDLIITKEDYENHCEEDGTYLNQNKDE